MVGGSASKAAGSPRLYIRAPWCIVAVCWWESSPGDSLDDVAHVLASAVVMGEGPPILEMADAVLDPDTA
jgi:hypothetical protein